MSSKNILSFYRKGVRKIVINRPEKKNAFSPQMYEELADVLNKDAENDKIVVTIITGAGQYYSSGNDLTSALEPARAFDLVRHLVQAFIDYPKLIIAVLNGPAIGIAATTAALCDIIYMSDNAYLDTPFLRLGLCAEGCSSYTFPRILGRSKASEALFLNKKISAQEAYQFGLVSEVIPHERLDSFMEDLGRYGSLPVNTLKLNKQLAIRPIRDILTEANSREIECLKTCVQSEEFGQAVMAFMQKKSKL